jgi:MFS family permease
MTSAGGAGLGVSAPRGFLAPYAEIFSIPRAWRFSVAGIIGRMPMSMYGLGTVLLISAGTGRYGLAGSVSAAGSIGGAICAPQLGRLTDRVGQHRVLVPVCVIFALSVAGLVAAVTLRAPDWTLFLCGIAGGATMPQTGPMARARWSALLGGSPRLHTAFSIESVADELCFVIGPAAVTLLATQVHPAAGVTCAALCALLGSLWFASQRSTEPPITAAQPATRPPASRRAGLPLASRGVQLAAPGLIVLVPVYLFLGAMFVAVDLSTVAFASHQGHKPLAGLVLGTYALGSGVGGLWYGSRTWRAPAWQRLAITLPLTVAGVCTFWAMPNLLVLTLVIFLCGMTIAPSLIAGYSLLESTARPGRATEAMSWLSTGISIGLACGSTAVGFILDAFGARWGYAFAAAAGVTAALIYLGGLRRVAASPARSLPLSGVGGFAGVLGGQGEDLVDVPGRVVVVEDRLAQARAAAGRAVGAEQARGARDGVERVHDVWCAGVAEAVDAPGRPRGQQELHRAEGASGGGAHVLAVGGLDLADRGEYRPGQSRAVPGGGRLEQLQVVRRPAGRRRPVDREAAGGRDGHEPDDPRACAERGLDLAGERDHVGGGRVHEDGDVPGQAELPALRLVDDPVYPRYAEQRRAAIGDPCADRGGDRVRAAAGQAGRGRRLPGGDQVPGLEGGPHLRAGRRRRRGPRAERGRGGGEHGEPHAVDRDLRAVDR